MRYVHKHFFKDGWSLDVCSNRATAVGAFSSRDVVCTKTLYNYVDQGLLDIHNYDLPEKLKCNTKLHRIRKNKKKLGRSIEERPKEINKRNEFGHYTSVKLLLLITHFYLFICLLFHSKSDHHYYETKSKSNHIDQPT